MTIRLVPPRAHQPRSPYFGLAASLTRSQVEQWRHESSLERPFRVLLSSGEVVPFGNERMAKVFAELWKGEVLP